MMKNLLNACPVERDLDKTMKRQAGFTIVELAIAVVIIGIILGAVLKGSAIIDSARTKNLYAFKNSISQAMYAYHDQYSYFPGDDPNMLAKWPALAVTNGNGNGAIASGIASTAPAVCLAANVEQCSLWSALRQAGFLSGTGFTNPSHSYGNQVAVTFYTTASWGAANALITHWIVFMSVPGQTCQVLDAQHDDGNWQTGSVRGSATYTSSSLDLFFRL
ncbi:MAG TPA: prepilin-type N-terminal cleavage/methylation domain-containing protein [Syntrophorhabdaceae bacterium]|nr:prepilin-type N-terminal cleavage/methylation domain-containing protein [Syntrophorhabdaceae bacterium]